LARFVHQGRLPEASEHFAALECRALAIEKRNGLMWDEPSVDHAIGFGRWGNRLDFAGVGNRDEASQGAGNHCAAGPTQQFSPIQVSSILGGGLHVVSPR
jgi:hypothetical protein